MPGKFRFLLTAVTAGIAAALVLMVLRPAGLKPVIQIAEAPPRTDTVAAQANPDRGPASYADAVSLATPAVVNVHTAKLVTERSSSLFSDPAFRQFFGDPRSRPRRRLENSLGSGVIVSPQGYVLTNHHVIDGANQIRVQLQDERIAAATVVGSDPETDLSVLRIEMDDLPAVVLGDSENLQVGDVVLAIGNPFGVGQTVTMGIVSATRRNDLNISTFENFIQTDAAINPGNSGGALINAQGQLVGINTAIFSKSGGSQGIGFAIPVSLAKGIMFQIIELGRVRRGWLGIEIQDVTPALAESFGLPDTRGVVVAGIVREGPADQAGIQPGDVIVGIGARPVEGGKQTLEAITRVAPGERVAVRVVRDRQTQTMTVMVGERPSSFRR